MNLDHGFLESFLGGWLPWLYLNSYWWTAVGFTGNILFGSRFFFQWLSSEKRKRVVVPAYFWHLSFWGSVLNLFYALHLDSAPILLGVAALPFIYGRNLVLLYRSGYPEADCPPPERGRAETKLAGA